MNAETVVRQFLSLFHTRKLDVGAVPRCWLTMPGISQSCRSLR